MRYLGNYLELLVIRDSGKGNDGLRIYGIRSYLRKLVSGNTLVEVAQRLNLRYKNLRNWIGKNKTDVGIPVDVALKLSRKFNGSENTLFRNATIFGCTNSKKYSLPKYTSPALAYLLGYIIGDGHLANPWDVISNGSTYNAEIRITTGDKQHLLYLRKIFFELFSYTPPLFKEGTFYRLIARAKTLHVFLHNVCGIPTGNKKHKTLVPPLIIGNKLLESWFLAGFFDSDGSVTKQKTGWNIRIKQFNKRVLEESETLLLGLGIKISGIYADYGERNGTPTKSYVLAIQKQSEVNKFISAIPSLKLKQRGCHVGRKRTKTYSHHS